MVPKIFLPVIGVAVAGLVATGGMGAMAHVDDDGTTRFEVIVQRLVERFDLNRDEVVEVFEGLAVEHRAEVEAKVSQRLDMQVEKGNLTTDQRNALEAKRAELRAQFAADREAFSEMSSDERKAFLAEREAELRAWAVANEIDVKFLARFGAEFHRGGMNLFKHRDRGRHDDDGFEVDDSGFDSPSDLDDSEED